MDDYINDVNAWLDVAQFRADNSIGSESCWRKNGDWKARYSKLYSTSAKSKTWKSDEEPPRISFMSNDSNAYPSLLRARSTRRDSLVSGNTILSCQSDLFSSFTNFEPSDNLGGHDTMLLDMVRAKSKELREEQEDTLDLPQDDDVSEFDPTNDACVHGLGLNIRPVTDRSVSRSRFSRVSTRRDMDIPSILAFTTTVTAPTQLENPAFKKMNLPQDDIPRWSIRRSVCPVCSMKWKDRSELIKIKNSGLKRNSSLDMPSVIAPARLRAAITMAYVPRPALAAVDEELKGIGIMHNPSSTWQLTRARRFRAPKQQMPSAEASAPPKAAAPMARKDLTMRVNRFLADTK